MDGRARYPLSKVRRNIKKYILLVDDRGFTSKELTFTIGNWIEVGGCGHHTYTVQNEDGLEFNVYVDNWYPNYFRTNYLQKYFEQFSLKNPSLCQFDSFSVYQSEQYVQEESFKRHMTIQAFVEENKLDLIQRFNEEYMKRKKIET